MGHETRRASLKETRAVLECIDVWPKCKHPVDISRETGIPKEIVRAAIRDLPCYFLIAEDEGGSVSYLTPEDKQMTLSTLWGRKLSQRFGTIRLRGDGTWE